MRNILSLVDTVWIIMRIEHVCRKQAESEIYSEQYLGMAFPWIKHTIKIHPIIIQILLDWLRIIPAIARQCEWCMRKDLLGEELCEQGRPPIVFACFYRNRLRLAPPPASFLRPTTHTYWYGIWIYLIFLFIEFKQFYQSIIEIEWFENMFIIVCIGTHRLSEF